MGVVYTVVLGVFSLYGFGGYLDYLLWLLLVFVFGFVDGYRFPLGFGFSIRWDFGDMLFCGVLFNSLVIFGLLLIYGWL